MSDAFPVVRLVVPMPLSLAAAIYGAISDAAEDQGYEAFCTEAEGLGLVYVRKAGSAPEASDATGDAQAPDQALAPSAPE